MIILEILAWWLGGLAAGVAFVAIVCPRREDVMRDWPEGRGDVP